MLPSRRLARTLALLLGVVAFAFGPSTDAFAGGKKKAPQEIERTGIQSLDSFFKEAADIDNRLDRAQKARRTGRTSVATAVGVKKDASLGAALKELHTKANGNLRLAVSGGVPQLSPAGALPSDVTKGIEAVNTAMTSYVRAIDDLAGVPGRTAALVKKAQKMPEKLKAEFVPFNPMKIPTQLKAIKIVKNNIVVTKDLPKRTKKVVKGLNSDMKTVVETFGGTWPPKMGGS